MLDTIKEYCPYCGEPIELVLDASAGDQTYIEDCFVCCRPITVSVTWDDDMPSVSLLSEDDI